MEAEATIAELRVSWKADHRPVHQLPGKRPYSGSDTGRAVSEPTRTGHSFPFYRATGTVDTQTP